MPDHRFDRLRLGVTVSIAAACLGVASNSGHGQEVQTTSISKEQLLNPARIRLDERLLLSGKLTDSKSRIAAVAVAAHETVYLLDSGNRKLTVVEAGGRAVRTVPVLNGSREDFKPIRMAVARDSLLILGMGRCTDPCPQVEIIQDGGATRTKQTVPRGTEVLQMLVFDTKGAFRETIHQHEPRLRIYAEFRGTDSGWVAQGRVLTPTRSQARVGPLPDSLLLYAFHADSGRWSRMLSAPMGPSYSTGFFIYPRFMRFNPTFAVASDATIYTNDVGGFAINARSASGIALHRITGDVDRIPVTDAEMQANLKEAIERGRKGSQEGKDYAKELVDHGAWVGREEFRPVLGEMFASRGGRVMVRRIDIESISQNPKQSVWDLVSVSQGLIGRLTLPIDERVEAFEWPFLYTRLGSEHGRAVLRYRLIVDGPNRN
ncbi:MAG: hypothetical protein WEE89_08995 [Gemmatimonadota bacterium]